MPNVDKARKLEWQRARRRAIEGREHCCSRCAYAFEGPFYLRRHEKSCLQQQNAAKPLPPMPISSVDAGASHDHDHDNYLGHSFFSDSFTGIDPMTSARIMRVRFYDGR
jgi:hypothetical protein